MVHAPHRRASVARDAHLGAGDGAVARDRGGLSSPTRCSTGTAASPRAAGRPRRRGDRHSRRAERPAAPRRARPLHPRAAPLVAAVRRASARPDAPVHSDSSTSCRSAAGRARDVLSTASCDHRSAPPRTGDSLTTPMTPTVRSLLAPERRELARRARSARDSRRCDFGYRERVTDVEHAAHPRPARSVLPGTLRRRRRARRSRGVRRRRAALRARLHHGLVPLGAEHPRATATAATRENRVAPAARGLRARCARASAIASSVGCRFLADECIDGRQPASTTRSTSASRSRAPAWTSSRCRAAASSRTRSSRRSARPPIPTPGRAATSACRP